MVMEELRMMKKQFVTYAVRMLWQKEVIQLDITVIELCKSVCSYSAKLCSYVLQ